MHSGFDNINTWIFDLDNTLYPAECNLFELIDQRMGLFVQNLLGCDAQEARRVQKGYFVTHGTTLTGLMAHHDVDPHGFLDFVHDIELTRLSRDETLVRLLEALPGRRIVFTNGDVAYAGRVLDSLGLGHVFEAVFDIHAMAYRPKPVPESYDLLCKVHNIDPARAIFVEDMARNLRPAKALGMATLWINNGSEYGSAEACSTYIDFETHDLRHWLAEQKGATNA